MEKSQNQFSEENPNKQEASKNEGNIQICADVLMTELKKIFSGDTIRIRETANEILKENTNYFQEIKELKDELTELKDKQTGQTNVTIEQTNKVTAGL